MFAEPEQSINFNERSYFLNILTIFLMYIATVRQKSETSPVPKAKTENVLANFTEKLKRMKEDIRKL